MAAVAPVIGGNVLTWALANRLLHRILPMEDVVLKAWGYVAEHYRCCWTACMAKDGCWEYLTFLNYVASCFPDDSWSEGGLTPAERKEILAFCFKHWRHHYHDYRSGGRWHIAPQAIGALFCYA